MDSSLLKPMFVARSATGFIFLAAMLAGIFAVPVRAHAAGTDCIGVQSDKDADAPADSSKTDKSKDAAPEFHMTPQQASDLFGCIDPILKFISDDTKYPIKSGIKHKLVTRPDVTTYLMKKFDEDKSSQKLEQSELVLKKFGLLNHDFNLRPFLLSLLTEQIAGYYDDKTRTVNMLDWIEPDEQKPVLAHELTHALQDQHSALKKWGSVTLTTTAHNVREDNDHIATDEVDDTRDAVLEGQAMAVFVDYGLKPMNKSLLTQPEIIGNIVGAMADTTGSPVMARAPLMLQQTLVFPYSQGLAFTAAVLHARGAQNAFAGVMDNPPSSTFEIMHPDLYLARTPVPALHLADIHPLIDKDYAPYDVGVMGALDVQILTELFGGDSARDVLTPAWDGGVYYAAQRRNVTDAEKKTTGSLALIYYSRWKNSDSARTFLRVYINNLQRKYDHITKLPPPADADTSADNNEAEYTTNEGDVLLVQKGRSVFIAEGYPMALARQLCDRVTFVQSDAPSQIAAATPAALQNGELLAPFSEWMNSLGTMKFTLAKPVLMPESMMKTALNFAR
jgi:hypothetical protein